MAPVFRLSPALAAGDANAGAARTVAAVMASMPTPMAGTRRLSTFTSLPLPWGKRGQDAAAPVQSPQGRKRYGQTVPERGTCSEIRYESTVLSTHELPWK